MTTQEAVMAYYESWTKGPTAKVDSDRLRKLFAANLEFESPQSGHQVGAEHLIAGVGRFGPKVKSMKVVHSLFVGDEGAVMYDADLTAPEGTHRFTEFFKVRDGKIERVHLLYDATPFRQPS